MRSIEEIDEAVMEQSQSKPEKYVILLGDKFKEMHDILKDLEISLSNVFEDGEVKMAPSLVKEYQERLQKL